MTHPAPDWDLAPLGHPLVRYIPDPRNEPETGLDEHLVTLAARILNQDPAGCAAGVQPLLRTLAVAGVVALRTSTEIYEIREALAGWTLVRTWGEPEPAELAAAAWIRAHRLAHARHTTSPPSGPTHRPRNHQEPEQG